MRWKKAKVEIMFNTKPMDALVNGKTWNGWLEPMMTKCNVRSLIQQLIQASKENGDYHADDRVVMDVQWVLDNFDKHAVEIYGKKYVDVSLGMCWEKSDT